MPYFSIVQISFIAHFSFYSLSTQILLVAMEMSLMMASNRIISLFFSLPPNKKIATQVHRPLGIPQICFSQFVKSQKMYANLFTFVFLYRNVPKLLSDFNMSLLLRKC